MTQFDRTDYALLVALPLLIVAAYVLPSWMVNYIQVSLGTGLVALGVLIQMRAGLVSFGQGLYFCTGGYAAGMAAKYVGITDFFVLLGLAVLAALFLSVVLGFLLRRYREIFFAMLSLAVSMILYGLLSSSESLGSTDGFNLPVPTYLVFSPEGDAARLTLYVLTVLLAVLCALGLNRVLRSPLGLVNEAIRENELRVEYLGASAHRAVHVTYVIAACVSSVGGVLWALSLGHVDPEMTNWTTSGAFVFVVILAGSGNIIAPLVGTFLLEILRVYAVELSPNTWQMILGTVMLLTIIFLPKGLWSLIPRTSTTRAFDAPSEPATRRAT